jgi:hypothetical protein
MSKEILAAAKYRVLEKSLVGNILVGPGSGMGNRPDILEIGAGTEVAYEGFPGGNLAPLNEAAEQAFELATQADKARLAALAVHAQIGAPQVNITADVAAQIAKAAQEAYAQGVADAKAALALQAEQTPAEQAEQTPAEQAEQTPAAVESPLVG